MGSSSTSITSYSANTPTVQDNENPIVLSGSGNQNGNNSTSNIGGNYTALDGGAIAAAFGFGEKSISAVADLTAKLLGANADANVAALDFTGRANAAANALANPDAAAEGMTNKTLWIFGGLVALYFLTKGRLHG